MSRLPAGSDQANMPDRPIDPADVDLSGPYPMSVDIRISLVQGHFK